MHHQSPSRGASVRRRTTGLVVAVAAIAVPTGLSAAGTETAPPSEPAPAAADAMAYCTAHLAAEYAVASGDPAAIGPAFAAIVEAAPAELAEAVAYVTENPPADDGPPSVEFNAAYNQLTAWVKDNCGFASVDVLATEYAFGGLPEEVPAGPTVLTLTNDGEEMHELVLIRKNDGVTTPIDELLALPEEELFSQIQPLNGTIVAPGESGSLVIDLTPGNYVALCFIPVGTTPEMMEQMMAAESASTDAAGASSESAPAGSEPPPHFAHGMVQEFSVVGDTIEIAGTDVPAPPTSTA